MPTNKLGSSSPRNCLRLSQGAGQRLHGASHAHAGGGPRYDKQNFHSTQHTGTCTCLSILEQIPREKERSPLLVTRLAQPICQYVLTVRKNSARDTAKHAHHQVYRRHVRMNMMASRSSFENIIFRGMALSRTFLFVLGPIGVFSETVILFDQSPISHY